MTGDHTREPWPTPRVQPGDLILNGTVTDTAGHETPVRVLYRVAADGRAHVTGYDGPLTIPAGGTFVVDLPDGDPT